MKKIIGGFVGIFLAIGIVAGTGYALYSEEVKISGLVLGTGTSSITIQVKHGDIYAPSEAITTIDLNDSAYGGYNIDKLVPGSSDWGHIKLTNGSDPTINYALKGRLTSATGDWNLLKDVISIEVFQVDSNDNRISSREEHTLAEWNHLDGIALPGSILGAEPNEYWVVFKLPDHVSSSYADKELTNVQFIITGTQQ